MTEHCSQCGNDVQPVRFDLEDPEHCPFCGHVFND